MWRSCFLLAFGCGVRTPLVELGVDAAALDASVDAPPADVSLVDPGDGCVGLKCQIPSCSNAEGTTITGTVYAPNGELPIYNAIVYVPNAKVESFTPGVQCDRCGKEPSGQPIVTALTDAAGRFTLQHTPSGTDIPLVVQLGKWRRQIRVPSVVACAETNVDRSLTRFPKDRTEGDMPSIAISTGYACGHEAVSCLLPKLGIASTEYGAGSNKIPPRAVSFFAGAVNGFVVGPAPFGAPSADLLWFSVGVLKNYDAVILSCRCGWVREGNGVPLTAYLNAGGRLLTMHDEASWYADSPDPILRAMTAWGINSDRVAETRTYDIDRSFPKGKALADWMLAVSKLPAYAMQFSTLEYGRIHVAQAPFENGTTSYDQKHGLSWFEETQHFGALSMRAPIGSTPAQQCGRAIQMEPHVNDLNDLVTTSFPAGCKKDMSEGELAVAFFLFEMSSCIQDDRAPVVAPPAH